MRSRGLSDRLHDGQAGLARQHSRHRNKGNLQTQRSLVVRHLPLFDCWPDVRACEPVGVRGWMPTCVDSTTHSRAIATVTTHLINRIWTSPGIY